MSLVVRGAAVTELPTAGSSTNTTSPSLSAAYAVMPTVAVSPSRATHSCSAVYLRAVRSVMGSSGRRVGCSAGALIERESGHGRRDAGPAHVDEQVRVDGGGGRRHERHGDGMPQRRAQGAAGDLADGLAGIGQRGVAGPAG